MRDERTGPGQLMAQATGQRSGQGEAGVRSVNWEHGMLLTPEHFLRQERYLEGVATWAMRYLATAAGLVGGGVRLPESDLGTVRWDPEVSLWETPEFLEISVARARGVTPGGRVVEVEGGGAISARIGKEQLAGVAEAVVYVVWDDNGARVAVDGVPDEWNPQMQTERVPSYRVALTVTAAERADSLAVARVRRPASGMQFEADAQFIPPCAAISGHSELMAGTRRIADAVTRLAAGYAELHRAMREFMVLFAERGLETEVDRDSMQFAERMVLELQDTAYGLLDRTQGPESFFARVRRLLHSAAIFFDLAPGMQGYYRTLQETGESEMAGLIEQQRHMLGMGRTMRLGEDLGVEVRRALGSLHGLERLERALEGKYIDFRRSRELESTNFIFDRGGKALYKLAARPARVQGIADDMTIFFSNLRLEGRDRYRLILVGDRGAPWQRGTAIGAEVRLNEGSGFRRESLILHGDVKLEEQWNLELDFEAPDVPTITDLRVTVPAYHTVHTALLFQRHRFYAGSRETPAGRGIEREPAMGEVAAVPGGGSAAGNGAGREVRPVPEMPRGAAEPGTGATAAGWAARGATEPAAGGAVQPPWMPRDRGVIDRGGTDRGETARPDAGGGGGAGQGGGDDGAAKPRRRRLE